MAQPNNIRESSKVSGAGRRHPGERERDRSERDRPERPAPARPSAKPKAPMPRQTQDDRLTGSEQRMEPRPLFRARAYRPAGKLNGRVALITGGDSGIGRAVSLLYAREGADLVIVYLPEDQDDADETRQLVEDEGARCVLIPGDVRDADFCQEAVERTVRELGKLDILINNAAYSEVQQDITAITDEQLDRTVKTNVYGYFYMARAAVKHLKPGGSIIMTGSGSAIEGGKNLIDYAMTKAANHALVKALSQNLTERGIRVNCVAPGPVWTPLVPASQPPELVEKFGSGTPMGRPAQPEELAPAYVFLASEADSGYVSGEILTVFGGKPGPG